MSYGRNSRSEPKPLLSEGVVVAQITIWLLIAGARWWLGPWAAAVAGVLLALSAFTELRRADLQALQFISSLLAGWLFYVV